MGAAEGFGWADLSQLTEPISTSMGVAWLVVAIVVVSAGVMILAGIHGWWLVSAIAALASQAVIVTSWADASAGTAANVLLALAAVYGFRAHGPTSFRARCRRLADATVVAVQRADRPGGEVVTEDDLLHLPAPVAGYVRAGGAVGRPRVVGFRAAISGRIRSGPGEAWMPWTGAQVNTFGPEPSRVFFMDATMKGIPTDVLHVFVGPTATMQVRLASLVPIVDARGPKMDQAETVTLLNDLCILAPAALVDAPVDWTPIDDRHARARFTNAGHTVEAVLTFNDDHELVDFVSDDRFVSSRDGRTFTPQRWSTPITEYRSINGRRAGVAGTGRWHPPDAPSFDYLEFHADHISYIESGVRVEDVAEHATRPR
jgi:membrane protein implicated in regulation of membrane protease activity